MSLYVPGRRVSRPSELCETCEKKEIRTNATVYCEMCDEFQCEACSKAHQLYSIMENHTVVKASENRRHLVGLNLCDEHEQEIRFFCEEDDELCCGTCAFLNHRNCATVEDIDVYARMASQSTGHLIGTICEIQDTAMSRKIQLEEQAKNLQSHVETELGRIDELQTKVDELFGDMLQNVVKNGKEVSEEIKSAVTARQSDCRTLYADIEVLVNIADNVLNKISLESMFIVQNILADIYNMRSAKLKDIRSDMVSFNFDVSFEEKLLEFQNSGNDFANLKVLVKISTKL